jgi:hypothetical protein
MPTSHADTLKSMLYDFINDRQEQAAVTMHDYFVAKSREVANLAPADVDDEITVDELDADELDQEI